MRRNLNPMTVAAFNEALANGPYAWPGGYPLFFVMGDGEAMSFKACEAERERIAAELADTEHGDAEWSPIALKINWEDAALYCVHTNERIESAYADDDETANSGEA